MRKFFKFKSPTLVQTPATIEATENYQWFYLRNPHTDSCYCWHWLRIRVRHFKNFWLRVRIRIRKKTQNPAAVDSGTRDPWPPLLWIRAVEYIRCAPGAYLSRWKVHNYLYNFLWFSFDHTIWKISRNDQFHRVCAAHLAHPEYTQLRGTKIEFKTDSFAVYESFSFDTTQRQSSCAELCLLQQSVYQSPCSAFCHPWMATQAT